MVAAWVIEELASLELGDKRREKRARIMVDQLAQISDSQPDAAKGKAALKANYRFVDHPRNSPEAILNAHHQASIARTALHERVVLAQDTTVLDLTKPHCQVQGAGPLESDDKRGVFLHPLYAMTEEGLPLGVVDEVIWAREAIHTDLTQGEKERLRKQMAFEEKESSRWLEMFQSGEQIARANPGTDYTVVGDSESDICELFAEVGDLAENCHFIIRGCQNRAIIDGGGAANVDEALAAADLQFTSQVNISERTSKIAGETRPRRKSRSARMAEIGVRARQVTIRGPARPGGKLPNVTLNVVEAVELDPPAGEEPIRWVLFTTLGIDSIAQIQRVISAYSIRWNIELYFKTLKSGLKIEKLKYETLDRYLTALSMLMIVGWRVEYLKGAARHDPEGSCEAYFSAEQWQPAYLVATDGGPLPAEPLTIRNFMLMIAELGGWQRKKSQGPPGSMTIWRGLRRMEAYADAFQAFQKIHNQDVGDKEVAMPGVARIDEHRLAGGRDNQRRRAALDIDPIDIQAPGARLRDRRQ
jgi:hypothetical protein